MHFCAAFASTPMTQYCTYYLNRGSTPSWKAEETAGALHKAAHSLALTPCKCSALSGLSTSTGCPHRWCSGGLARPQLCLRTPELRPQGPRRPWNPPQVPRPRLLPARAHHQSQTYPKLIRWTPPSSPRQPPGRKPHCLCCCPPPGPQPPLLGCARGAG